MIGFLVVSLAFIALVLAFAFSIETPPPYSIRISGRASVDAEAWINENTDGELVVAVDDRPDGRFWAQTANFWCEEDAVAFTLWYEAGYLENKWPIYDESYMHRWRWNDRSVRVSPLR